MRLCTAFSFVVLSLLCLPHGAEAQGAGEQAVETGTEADIRAQQTEAAFLSALDAMAQGEPTTAIRILTDILARDPNLIRVRLELARAYFEAEEWARSRREFFAILSAEIPEAVRTNVLWFIREIDARRGVEWNAQIGFAKLGNGRRYDSDEIELDFGGFTLPSQLDRNTDTTLGLRASADVTARAPVGFLSSGRSQVLAFGTLMAAIEDGPNTDYDDVILEVSPGLRYVRNLTTLNAALVGGKRFVRARQFEDRYGLRLNGEHRWANGQSVFSVLSYEQLNNRQSDSLDGHRWVGEIGYSRAVGGRAIIGASAYFENKTVEFDLENYRNIGFAVFGSADIGFGLTIRPRAYFENRHFETPSPLFVSSPDENSYGLRLRVEKNDIFVARAFTPFVSVSYQRTESDIDAFSYREFEYAFGLDRRF